jgi:two-component system response regulator RegX3
MSDDIEMGNFWRYVLNQKGIEALLIEPADNLIDILVEQSFDLILIDQYTAKINAHRLVRELRSEVSIPILLLLSNQGEDIILEMYRAGIDECVVRPISPHLLLAKVTAWLNRSWTIPTSILDSFRVGDVQLDPAQRQFINPDGTGVRLTHLEYRLLYLLMSHPGQILDANVIVERVWGYDYSDNTALLKNMVYRLRRKIEPEPGEPRYIVSITGEGYQFQP